MWGVWDVRVCVGVCGSVCVGSVVYGGEYVYMGMCVGVVWWRVHVWGVCNVWAWSMCVCVVCLCGRTVCVYT